MDILNIKGTKVLFEKNSSPIVNIQILTNIGSSDESPKEYGMAHFLEHMFFKGTSKRGAIEINQEADLLGAKLNAWTWYDQTCYHLSVMKEHFEAGFELLSDIYLNATIPEDEIEKERTVILSEMRRYEDDPPTYLSEHATDHFSKNGLGHKVIGTKETLLQFTREDLLAFKTKYYGGQNILLSIVGDLEVEDLTRIVEQYFTNHPIEATPAHSPGNYSSGHLSLTKNDIQESQYILLYPALPYTHPQAIKQTVMSSVLGGNASALLFERIREELGLCYGIYSRAYRFEGFNYLEISTGCRQEDLPTIHDEVLKIIEKLKSERITERRLQMVKASMKSSFYMGIESSSGLNSFLSLSYMRGDRGNIIENRVQAIDAVTLEDVQKMANETFQQEPLLATLTPKPFSI